MADPVNIHRPTGLLSAAIAATQADGSISGLDTLSGGSGYDTPGTYTAVALTGGSGTGATADITVAAGAVTVVTLVDAGTGYTDNDSLSAANADIGGRTGGGAFSVAVNLIHFTPNNVVAATAGKRIRVYRLIAVTATADTLTVKRGSTALTGDMSFAANSGLVLETPATWIPWFVTGAGEAFDIIAGTVGTVVAGEVLYSLEAA